MLLEASDLHEAFEQLAARRGSKARLDRSILLAALVSAEQLADGQTEDEPAALFAELARRSSAFAPVAETFVCTAVRAQAISLGYELIGESIEFTILRAGVLRDELSFEHLRLWFAKRLRPMAASP